MGPIERAVIIGGGECGVRAAMSLRSAGFGGTITLACAEPLLPYERPPLSKSLMASVESPAPKTVVSAEALAAARVDVLLGSAAAAIDVGHRAVRLTTGGTLPFDKLLIATGSQPRRLASEIDGANNIAYLRTFRDAINIRGALGKGRRVAIVGGGFIGLEVAAAAIGRGCQVTVLEALPRLLSRVVPPQIADIVREQHLVEGVIVRCSTRIVSICQGADQSILIATDDGERVSADFLVVGIGALPACDLAVEAGLEIADGIVVDEYLRTSSADIYAAGDCCCFPLPIYGGRRVRLECWRNAQDQGLLAGRNMAGADERLSSLPWFWSDQYDLTLQIVGLVDEGYETVRRPVGDGGFVLFHLAADGRLVAASGIGRGTTIARDIRLAEMLILRGARPDSSALKSPATKLKSLLAV